MPVFATLFSGSGGNAALLSDGKTHILIDAGVSAKRLTIALNEFGIHPCDLAAVLVTHEHGDHVCGLEVLSKHCKAPVYMSEHTANGMSRRRITTRNLRLIYEHEPLEIGGVAVTAIPTPHDTEGSVGYIFNVGAKKLGYFTDLGRITPTIREAVQDTDCLFIESNHDVERLRRGPYPEHLKLRILSSKGHLSNEACGDLIFEAANWGVRRLTLCHLSRENNTPELARRSAEAALRRALACDVSFVIAPPDCASEPYEF